jgi:hypothetical protein
MYLPGTLSSRLPRLLFTQTERTAFAGAGTSSISGSLVYTEGTDVFAGRINRLVVGSSATTDGADVLSGNVSPIIGASLSYTDGADVLASGLIALTVMSVSYTRRRRVSLRPLSNPKPGPLCHIPTGRMSLLQTSPQIAGGGP